MVSLVRFEYRTCGKPAAEPYQRGIACRTSKRDLCKKLWCFSQIGYWCLVFTARSSYASAVLGILILSVCLSVTRVLCSETKEHTADILTPHERIITLVFWYQQTLVCDTPISPFTWNLRLKWPPLEKCRLRPLSAYNVWTVRDTEKCSIIANKSTTRFPTSCRWGVYLTPNSPKRWLKKRICRFYE